MTLNPKVARAIKKLEALFSEDANKVMEKAIQDKATKENLNFFIYLASIAMVAEEIKSTEETILIHSHKKMIRGHLKRV